jgi:hypothetical protein
VKDSACVCSLGTGVDDVLRITVGMCMGRCVPWRPASASLGVSHWSSKMCCTSCTSAPDCAASGCASGLHALGTGVSRDEEDDGGGLLCVAGLGAGVFGSLVPVVPSDEGELSHRGGSWNSMLDQTMKLLSCSERGGLAHQR